MRILLMIIIIISMITPLIYSFTFFNGFAGQIKPTDYPPDWYEVNKFLDEDRQDFKILFFPWHGYMEFKWVNNTDKRIANPSRYFFNKETISGTTVELGGIYRQDNDPIQLYIDNLLSKKNKITNFGLLISVLNVKYVILAKEVDYKNYRFLFDQKDLELIRETENLYVFKNKNSVAKIFQTDNIDNISSDDVANTINYEDINPVKFKIGGEVKKKYIVFTESYNEDWKLDGREGVKAYGVVNAYLSDDNRDVNKNVEREIIFERFYKINLPSYIISIITFVVLIIMYIKS